MAVIGYARVSTADQNMALQLDALREAGVERVFSDQGVSGSTADGAAAGIDQLSRREREIIWQAFRRGSGAMRQGVGGSGMGLTIVREMDIVVGDIGEGRGVSASLREMPREPRPQLAEPALGRLRGYSIPPGQDRQGKGQR